MRNFLNTVVTYVQRLNLFLRDSITTLARLLRLTPPSVQQTYNGVSYDSTRMRHLTTATGLRVMNEGRRLTSRNVGLRVDKNGFCKCDYCTTGRYRVCWSLKNDGATTSSSEETT